MGRRFCDGCAKRNGRSRVRDKPPRTPVGAPSPGPPLALLTADWRSSVRRSYSAARGGRTRHSAKRQPGLRGTFSARRGFIHQAANFGPSSASHTPCVRWPPITVSTTARW